MRVVLPAPSRAVIIGDESVKEWRETQKVFVDGAQFTQKFKAGFWDGYTRPGELNYLNKGTWGLKVSYGFLKYFLADFPDTELEYQYDPHPIVNLDDWSDEFRIDDLRDYQRDALEMVFTEHWGRVALATNAGKGAIIGIASAMAQNMGMNVLVLADEVSVFQALKEEIETWGGLKPALVESGRDDPPTADVTLAMVPTLTRRIGKESKEEKRHARWKEWRDWLQNIDMVLLDEADRAAAKTWVQILSRMKRNYYRIGFSGSFDTQKDEKELHLSEIMGPILIQVKNKDLIERNISAKPLVQLVQYIQTFEPPNSALWFEMPGPQRRQFAFEMGVMYNEERHQLIVDMLEPNAQNAIVVNRVEHGDILEGIIPDARYLSGSDSKAHREEVLAAFRAGAFQNLITTKILDRGTNLLGTTVGLLFVSGEGSTTQTLQRVGRGLRRTGGKEFLYLKDIIDVPPPWAGRMRVNPYDYFRTASRKRVALYNSEGFEIEIHNVED